MCMAFDLAVPLLGTYPREATSGAHRHMHKDARRAAGFMIVKKRKKNRCDNFHVQARGIGE